MNTGVIIQARMGSTRLPGKVMKKLAGKEVLWHVVDRLKRSKHLKQIIVATTTNVMDDEIVEFCKKNNILYYRGDEKDVLKRYYEAAKYYKLDVGVRVTSDCPLIHPIVVDTLIEELSNKHLDYVTNSFKSTFARGLECSAFTFEALEKCFLEATLEPHREHVVLYIRENLNLFRTKGIENHTNESNYRVTLDEEADYTLLNMIYNNLYEEGQIIPIDNALKYILQNDLFHINNQVKQKS